MKELIITVACSVLIVTGLYSQKVREVPVDKYKYYIANNDVNIQIKNDLTVEVIPMHPGLLHVYPEFFSWDLDKMPSDWQINLATYYPKLHDGKYYEYPLRAGDDFINAFILKITNNTNHILRMGDARIYLRIDGEDPIKPVTKFGDATLVDVTPLDQSHLKMKTLLPKSVVNEDYGSLVYAVTKIWHDWDKSRKKKIITFTYPIGFPSQILLQNKKAYKLINDVNVEILPGDGYTGVLLFPRVMNDDVVNINFYDLTTKTDLAGNPIEKTSFDFKYSLSHNSIYYNRNENKWLVGPPPETVEFFDKKSKKWYYGQPKK